MPSLMDKLSAQLEYHRISAKYTKRKPVNPFSRNGQSYLDSHDNEPVSEHAYRDDLDDDDGFGEFSAHGHGMSAGQTGQIGQTGQGVVSAGGKGVVAQWDEGKGNSEPFINFVGNVNQTQPFENVTGTTTRSTPFNTSTPNLTQSTPLRHAPLGAHPDPNAAVAHDGFLSPFDDDAGPHRHSIDDQGFDYSNGTGLVSGAAKQGRARAVTVGGRDGNDNDYGNGYDNDATRDWQSKPRARGGSFSFLSAPVGGAAKAALSGLSNMASGAGKRNNPTRLYTDDRGYADNERLRSVKPYSDYADDEQLRSVKPYHDYSDDEKDTFSATAHNTKQYSGDGKTQVQKDAEPIDPYDDSLSDDGADYYKAPAPATGIWSKVKNTPTKIMNRRNTVATPSPDLPFGASSAGPSNDTAFRRPRFLSSASKSRLPSYDYDEQPASYRDNTDEQDRYSRDPNTRPPISSVPSSASLRSLAAIKAGLGFSSKRGAKEKAALVGERYRGYGFDDEEVAGMPAEDLSYRYKQGFGSSG